MAEISVGGHTYRVGKLNAKQQFDLLRRLGPALPVFWQERRDNGETIDGARWLLAFTSGALADMKQADSDFVLGTCLSVVERQTGPASWAKAASSPEVMMFPDIDVMTMMELTDAVLQNNLSAFFQKLRGGSASPPETIPEAAT